jgi:hypothetical protein
MSQGRIVRTEAETSVVGTRLPLLGKLKVGVLVKNEKTGKEYPQSIDWFRADGKYEKTFHEVYGAKPTKVEIVFFSDRFEDCCREQYELRDKGGRLLADGDGQRWRCWSDKLAAYEFKDGDVETIESLYRGRLAVVNGAEVGARETLIMNFILPKIRGVFGMWRFSTKGTRSSIPQIRDTYDQVKREAGFVANIPFDLIVEKVKSNKPGSTSVFPVVTLVPNIGQENMALLEEYVSQGKRLRGVLTEQRIAELVGTVESERPALPAASHEAPAIDAAVVDPPPDDDAEDGEAPDTQTADLFDAQAPPRTAVSAEEKLILSYADAGSYDERDSVLEAVKKHVGPGSVIPKRLQDAYDACTKRLKAARAA